jgi:hypothetical protein
MMSDLLQAIPGKGLDICVVRFLRSAMRILVEPEVLLPVERLRVFLGPCLHLGPVYEDGIRFRIDPRPELVQHLVVVVLADTRVDPKIPIVHTADKILSLHMPIGHQGTPVEASAIENGDVIVESHDDQVYG